MTALLCTPRSLTSSKTTAEAVKPETVAVDRTPAEVRSMLREIAFVLHATRAVKRMPKISIAEAD